MIRNFKGFAPQVAPSAYVDPSAQVIGDVVIGERSSIWPCATTRLSAVRWGIATRIVWAWVLTIPAAAAVAAMFWVVLHAVHPL